MGNLAISTLLGAVKTFVLAGLALYAPAVLSSGGNLHGLLDVSFAHKVLIAAVAAALHVVYSEVQKTNLVKKFTDTVKSSIFGKIVFSVEKDLNPAEITALKVVVDTAIKDLEAKAQTVNGIDVVETVIRELVAAYKA